MKLLMCLKCFDVFSLTKKVRVCSCGATKGKQMEDGLNAVYSGECVPLGMTNTSLSAAASNQKSEGDGVAFEAFVMPRVSETMRKVDDVE